MTPDAPADQQATSAPSAGAEQQTPEQQTEELGEGGTNAIKAARGERDKARAELKDYQALGTLQELQERLSGQQTPESEQEPPEPVDPEQALTQRVADRVRHLELREEAKRRQLYNVDDLFTYLTPEQIQSIPVDENDNADLERVRLVVNEVLNGRYYLSKEGDYRGAGIGSVGNPQTPTPNLADGYRARR
ncbi:hypothetical protein [Pseudoclavibacter helvolus]|uniref:hypothetical protein n=1 Tax=Pseudoclavibacter helvolus TaxID=255205 RepID=UPI000838A231|nr:hypothetical protein [Pseudoclavibacter helvolus]